MNLDWLYGPRNYDGRLRSMTFDVEVLRDLADIVEPRIADILAEVPRPVDMDGRPPRQPDWTDRAYWVGDRQIEEDRLGELSVADRNSLWLSVRALRMVPDGMRDIEDGIEFAVGSTTASIGCSGIGDPDKRTQLRDEAVEYLYRQGKIAIARPVFSLRRVVPFIPVALIVLGWIWATTNPGLPLGIHLIVATLATTAAVRATTTFRTRYSGPVWLQRSFNYRAESRAATNARRADSRANLKVAALSTAATLLVSIIAGITVWQVTEGREAPTQQQTPAVSGLSAP